MTIVNDINRTFGLNGIETLDVLYENLIQANKEKEDRLKRRGECGKYWAKNKRNECRASVDAQIAQIDGRIAAITQDIQAKQATEAGVSTSAISTDLNTNQSLDQEIGSNEASISPLVIVLALSAIGGLLFLKPKNRIIKTTIK